MWQFFKAGVFKKDPVKAKRQKRDALLEAAFNAQRNGNIREYSRLTTEAEEITQELDAMSDSQARHGS